MEVISNSANVRESLRQDYSRTFEDSFSTRMSTIGLSAIGLSREGILAKTATLNILRSLIKHISQIRDNLANYFKFDIICLKEAMCTEDLLPLQGDELMFEHFHKPIELLYKDRQGIVLILLNAL